MLLRDVRVTLRHAARILKSPEVQECLRATGGEPVPSTPDASARVIARDMAIWSKVIRDGNIKIN